jgi:hypothetical protein
VGRAPYGVRPSFARSLLYVGKRLSNQLPDIESRPKENSQVVRARAQIACESEIDRRLGDLEASMRFEPQVSIELLACKWVAGWRPSPRSSEVIKLSNRQIQEA